MGSKLYSTQEAADELNVSGSWIRLLVARGIAQPIRKIGSGWLFTAEEIERLRSRPKSKGGRPKKE